MCANVSNKPHTTKVAKILHQSKQKSAEFCEAQLRTVVYYEPLGVHWVYLLLAIAF